MDVIDEWSGPGDPDRWRQPISDRLRGFSPRILTVHCYRDVGFPWLHLVFEQTIAPGIALRAGAALVDLPGIGQIYLNSLRPRAVFFLCDSSFMPAPLLPAARYGELLPTLERVWAAPERAG